MFKNLFKNKFAINKIKDPTFPFKKSLFSPIITSSDKIIQIFKSLRVARVLLYRAKKVLSEYFAKWRRYFGLYSQEIMTSGTLLTRKTKF